MDFRFCCEMLVSVMGDQWCLRRSRFRQGMRLWDQSGSGKSYSAPSRFSIKQRGSAVCASGKLAGNSRQFMCGQFHQWTSMNGPMEECDERREFNTGT